jgi:cytosine/adenosine deaminase-related metal-dependent hydrolase
LTGHTDEVLDVNFNAMGSKIVTASADNTARIYSSMTGACIGVLDSKNNLLPRGSMLVHMNVLSNQDRLLLAPRGHDFSIVHCPKTHRFFERPPFDWKFFYHHKYPLLLGTDSLASNDSLNLFEEMRSMVATAPELEPEAILKKYWGVIHQ